MQHGLRGLLRTEDPTRPNIACLCGEIASGVEGAHWIIQPSTTPGLFDVTPSFNWPEHFHTYGHGVPFIKYSDIWPDEVEASYAD